MLEKTNCADCGKEATEAWDVMGQLVCKECYETITGQKAKLENAKLRDSSKTHGNTLVERGQVTHGDQVLASNRERLGRRKRSLDQVEKILRGLEYAKELERREQLKQERRERRVYLKEIGVKNTRDYRLHLQHLAALPADLKCPDCDKVVVGSRRWIVSPDRKARCVSCHRKKFPPRRRRDARLR
jgi:hypothetical protein